MARWGYPAGSDHTAWFGDRYRLGDVVGRGGMGEVRAATDVRLNREVAMKLLRADLADIDEVRQRFEDEARSAASLAHPNVVAVFDAGEEDGTPYIVMERLPGGTLADELTSGRMPAPEVRDLAVAVLGALAAAHTAGIVHRDVKPGNVLRAADGTWKVTDFGIAKIAEAAGDLTASGVLIGTPAYVSPERIAGDPATPASDVYSTGVVLYEALTGRKAFTAENQLALAEQIRIGRVPTIDDVLPGVDPSLAHVVERAMATDPSRRFTDAGEMLRALESHSVRPRHGSAHTDADTLPQVVPPTRTQTFPTRPRARRSAPRKLGVWLAAAMVVLVALVIVGVVLSQRDTGTSSPPNTTPTTTAAPGAAIPPALDRALDNLSNAVQR